MMKRVAPFLFVLGVVLAGVAAWRWDESRMRRRLDEALATLAPFVDGPVGTWFERLPPSPPPNASMRELERLARATPIDFGTAHVREDAWQQAHGTTWKNALREYVERSVAQERMGGGASPAPSEAAAYPSLAEPIREHLLAQPLPEWPAVRNPAATVWYLGSINRLADLLVADALVRHGSGDDEGAARSLDAAWRLVEAARRRDDVISQLIAWRIAGVCAAALRQVERPNPEWRERLDIQPFREAFLHASLVECFSWHAAARSRDVVPDWSAAPASGGLLAMLPALRYSRAERATVADALEAMVPFLEAMEDGARCGQGTIPVEWRPDLGTHAVNELTALTSPQYLRRLDRLRVRFELTRRVLDLRERRAEDPAGRWPAILGEEESECPGVRFSTTAPAPGIVAVEAVSRGGWLTSYASYPRAPPLRVELVQPVTTTGSP
jgi:hypothetical protein